MKTEYLLQLWDCREHPSLSLEYDFEWWKRVHKFEYFWRKFRLFHPFGTHDGRQLPHGFLKETLIERFSRYVLNWGAS